jgi:hypothetical protein
MQTVIFDFKRKVVAVAGTREAELARAQIIAAQRKIVANSPTTASQPTAR